MKGTTMKKLALALAGALVVLLPIGAGAVPDDLVPVHSQSAHGHLIDWD